MKNLKKSVAEWFIGQNDDELTAVCPLSGPVRQRSEGDVQLLVVQIANAHPLLHESRAHLATRREEVPRDIRVELLLPDTCSNCFPIYLFTYVFIYY